MAGENVPDWAIEKVLSLVNPLGSPEASKWTVHGVKATGDGLRYAATVLAFARYIAQHEEPPVDPLQECLRETYGGAAPEFVSAFRAALKKRGLEIRELSQATKLSIGEEGA